MGLGDSDGRGELPLIRLAKLTGLKGNLTFHQKEDSEGFLEVQLDRAVCFCP